VASLNKFLNLIIIFGCAIFAFFFYQYRADKEHPLMPQPVEQSSVKPSSDPLDLANKYLQEAQQNVNNDKLRASVNIKKALAESEAAQRQQPQPETDPSKVSAEQQIWKDPSKQQPTSLNGSIEKEYQRNEQLVAPSGMDKKEYIRQFKENARKNGYEITVNDDLEVTNVQPIRKPQNEKNDYDVNREEESEY
jgi:hypothetical protein